MRNSNSGVQFTGTARRQATRRASGLVLLVKHIVGFNKGKGHIYIYLPSQSGTMNAGQHSEIDLIRICGRLSLLWHTQVE